MNKYDHHMRVMSQFFLDRQVTIHYHQASLTDIKNAESEIGHLLPMDYHEFLSSYGGALVLKSFTTPDNYFEYDIESFYGVSHPNKFKDLVSQYHWLKDITPRDFLRIATSDEGFIALSLTGESKGAIYFVHWRDEDEIWSDVDMIAPSFDEFMRLLQRSY